MVTSGQCLPEDISSLPVPHAKFHKPKSDYLGQLIVTPDTEPKKIKF